MNFFLLLFEHGNFSFELIIIILKDCVVKYMIVYICYFNFNVMYACLYTYIFILYMSKINKQTNKCVNKIQIRHV